MVPQRVTKPRACWVQVDAELARLAAEPELRKEYYALWDVQRKYAFWQADDEPPAADPKPKARSARARAGWQTPWACCIASSISAAAGWRSVPARLSASCEAIWWWADVVGCAGE